ncbi:hypothetical protein [Sphingopyxis sp.]|uniref:hypothetical protein n=1 Tax=Sphingopyxis sp. TaxID=1908224 RepID=UPI001D3F43F9|nr:hypothetical protein [Sphingopyxis sp.]MBW8294363.1 hypothetical protein [Sphingopyxis sp.]
MSLIGPYSFELVKEAVAGRQFVEFDDPDRLSGGRGFGLDIDAPDDRHNRA